MTTARTRAKEPHVNLLLSQDIHSVAAGTTAPVCSHGVGGVDKEKPSIARITRRTRSVPQGSHNIGDFWIVADVSARTMKRTSRVLRQNILSSVTTP